MIPELERGRGDGLTRRSLARVLGLAPWLWPPDERDGGDGGEAGGAKTREGTDALAWAREVTGMSRPPAAKAGCVPGVTVTGCAATLWLLAEASAVPGEAGDAALAPDAIASWDAAALALPRSLPVLWESVRDAHRQRPILLRMAGWAPGGMQESIPRAVSGPSFGLAFVLLQASRIFDEPIPPGVIASAAVDAMGRVGPVDQIDLKVEAILRCAPRLTRLIVEAGQVKAAEAAVAKAIDAGAAGWPIRVVPVRSAVEALRAGFGDTLERRLIEAGTDPERRAELVESFLRLVVSGRGAAIDWTPVERAADLALEGWPDLTGDQRFVLELARAVAARHERNAGKLPAPPSGWLEARPLPLGMAVVTQYVQQAADVGEPDPVAAVAMSIRYLPNDAMHAYVEQLKLGGARARLRAVTGGAGVALEEQRAFAEAFAASLRFEEVSYPLTEWYRLAGVLGDRAAFDAADRLRAKVEALGGFGLEGSAYVELAKARAEVQLKVVDPHEPAPAVLERLVSSHAVPSHVRWSAARWLIAELAGSGERATSIVAATRAALERAAESDNESERVAARKGLALTALDTALAARDNGAAENAVESLRAIEPGLVGMLERYAPSGAGAGYVARFYPY